MTLGELMKVFRFADIHLHSGFDGKLIVKTKNNRLMKFENVRVLSVYDKIEAKDNWARAYLYVFGDAGDIQDAKATDIKEATT